MHGTAPAHIPLATRIWMFVCNMEFMWDAEMNEVESLASEILPVS